ncbi:MAG: hypothetical protein EAY72_00090, partial [Bacteroidetes bacterium]
MILMASKKYSYLLGLLALTQLTAFGQRSDANADWWKDSSKVATKNLPQFNEFNNNQYPYPARPRDQWLLGLGAGYSRIFGDVDGRPGFGGSISLRKALSHVWSIRGEYVGSFNSGLDYRRRTGGTGPWAAYGNQGYFANYQTRTHQGSIEAVASLNTISNYRGNPKSDVYVFAGYALIAADVNVDARNANGGLYNFSSVPAGGSRADIRSALKDNILDGTYEQNAFVANGSRTPIGRINDNWLLRHAATFGAGYTRKVSKTLSLGVEQRFTLPFDDDFDGIASGQSNDFISFTSIKAGINICSQSKRVAPLWQINPNNFIYNELNNPKHMKLPKPVLPDADGDGVTDQFDLEPSTPAGAPVDTHGVSRDSDGDGVPDFKDKELLTPQSCFPVNADGVGNCPEPACCKELREKIANYKPASECALTSLASVQFRANTATLSKDAQAVLATVAQQLNANPTCKVKVVGYGATDKRAQQLSYDHVNAVIKHL